MIDLHCHMDGSLPLETISKLATMAALSIPEGPELERTLRVEPDNQSLVEYLEKFQLPLVLLRSEAALKLAAYDVLKQAADEGVVYMELRYAPLLHVHGELSCRQVIEAVIAGVEQAEQDFDIHASTLLCAMRHQEVEENIEMLKTGQQYLGHGVCGLDLAGDEMGFPAELHMELFQYASNEGIPFTIHAGECGSAQNVANAIELGAWRIGHGVAAYKNAHVMQLCADRGIPLELCPVSNMHTKAVPGWKEYPIIDFLNKGIKATVNTDNRTVSNTSIQTEFDMLEQQLGLGHEQKKQLFTNAIQATFADDSVKDRLLKKVVHAL